LTDENSSEAASTYNTKFSKTIQQIIDEIQARKEWIGVDWVDESSDGEEVVGSSSKEPKRTVRLLDYACGTGLVSRVRPSFLLFPLIILFPYVRKKEQN